MLLTPKKILDKLVQKNIITADVLGKAQQITNIKELEDFLIKEGGVDGEILTKAKAEILNIPYIDLRDQDIDPKVFDIFSNDIIKNHKVVAFHKEGNELSVGMVDPQDFRAVQAVEFLVKKNRFKVKYFIISSESFRDVVKRNSSIGEEVEKALDIAKMKYVKERSFQKAEKISESIETVKGAPISKIVSVIIRHAVEGGASDIHIEPEADKSKIRYRVDGILHTSLVLPRHIHTSIISRIKIMAHLKIDETRIPQDGRIRLNIDNRQVDFRVSIFPLMESEKAVLRVLDTLSGILNLSELGFNRRHQEIVEENIKATNGMLLLTGPTGSGKTTTLYSILDILNKDDVNIITLEDPVEYFIAGINQSQVKPEIGYTFAAGLRSILRQDPNIIMVGEIRDGETAELAVHASLTGHFVLSTLHTNNAIGAIPRLIDMGVEPFLLSSTLKVVVAQRLVRKICSFCRMEIPLSSGVKQKALEDIKKIPKVYLKDIFKKDVEEISQEDVKFYKGKGCEECRFSGYKSRSVVAEILVVTNELKDLISEGYDESKIEEIVSKQNMITLKQDGILKALKGITTMEEVMRVIRD